MLQTRRRLLSNGTPLKGVPGFMTDGELRGVVLKNFYDFRNKPGIVSLLLLPEIFSIEPDPNRLINIFIQLQEHGLIQGNEMWDLDTRDAAGRITASGVDVVEGTSRPPITVAFHDHGIVVSQSSNVQIGDSNTISQTLGIQPSDLTRLVTELTTHLEELGLDARQQQRAEVQIATLKTELAGDPSPEIVRQAGHTIRNITEGAIGSLLATAAQPAVWQWVHQMLRHF
jgi:hypothetical protein